MSDEKSDQKYRAYKEFDPNIDGNKEVKKEQITRDEVDLDLQSLEDLASPLRFIYCE